MKTFSRIISVVAAVALTTVAVAQPAPGGPSGPFGRGRVGPVGPGGPIAPGRVAPPGRILNLVVPPPAPYYRHRRAYSGSVGNSTVVQVQRALKARGYYAGPVDGDAGSGTRAGIRGFREDSGLESSSRIDSSLLRALEL